MRKRSVTLKTGVLVLCTVAAGWVGAQNVFYQTPVPLMAGQNTTIGQVACGVDPSNEFRGNCRARTVPGWCLVKAHLYVGARDPGSMAPGQFPFHGEPGGCVADLTVSFLSTTACVGQPLKVAFHAEARQPSAGREETAWAQGTHTGATWSMMFELPCRPIND